LKRIDRYLIGKFLFNLAWSILAFWAVFVIINLVEHLDKFIDKGVPARLIALYYCYFTPQIVILIAPIGVLLATLFAVGFLAKRNELLAMRATGMSLWRLSLPFLFMGFVITGALFTVGETIFPDFEAARWEMQERYIKGRAQPVETILRNLYVPGASGRIYHFKSFNTKRQTGTDLTVQVLQDGRLIESVELSEVAWSDGIWTGGPGGRRIFTASGDSVARYQPIDTLSFPAWTETPEDIVRKRVEPQQMRYAELREAIDRLRRTGGDPAPEETELALKLAFPLINVIVILIGFPIASRTKHSGMALNFAFAMLITFIVRVLYEVFRSLGHNGELDPWVAAWAPNAISFVVGILVLMRVRK